MFPEERDEPEAAPEAVEAVEVVEEEPEATPPIDTVAEARLLFGIVPGDVVQTQSFELNDIITKHPRTWTSSLALLNQEVDAQTLRLKGLKDTQKALKKTIENRPLTLWVSCDTSSRILEFSAKRTQAISTILVLIGKNLISGKKVREYVLDRYNLSPGRGDGRPISNELTVGAVFRDNDDIHFGLKTWRPN